METVLHISEKADGGGAESVFRDTILALKIHDPNRKHIVACINSGNLPFDVELDFGNPKVSGFRLLLSHIFSFPNSKKLKAFLNKQKPNIIHLQNYGNLSPSILKALWEYKNSYPKVKIVHTVHTFEYICSNHAAYDYKKQETCIDCAKSTFKFKIFYRGCSRAGFTHSIGKGLTSLIATYYLRKGIIDHWITPSKFLLETMLSNKLIRYDKIKVIKNPLSKLFINALSIEASDINKKNQFIYFGRLSEEKNLAFLINTFYLFTQHEKLDYHLIIAGDGIEKGHLKLLAQILKISDKITFTGFLTQDELIAILKESKIAILPSKCFETASMVVLESISFDVVPLVANHGGMKEMVEWINYGKTFEVNNPQSMIEGIKSILNDSKNNNTEATHLARQKIKEVVNFANYAKEIKLVYDS
jgi:glycosyltransferase involved in cell wall biosynthesis